MYMSEAKELKDQVVYKGVHVKFSDKLVKAFAKTGMGLYARPNSDGSKTLLCIMNQKDVKETLNKPDSDPAWVQVGKLNLNKSRDVKNKQEALMLGSNIKLLVAKNANVEINNAGPLKKEEIAVKHLDNNEYLVCFESELEEFEKNPEKIPLTSQAQSKLFTVEGMVENEMKNMRE